MESRRQRTLPSTRSRSSPAGDHRSLTLSDTIRELSDQEHHLESQLEKLQERKKSLLKLLEKPSTAAASLQASPTNDSRSQLVAHVPRSKPRERVNLLAEQTRRLNDDLQTKLRELDAKGPAAEFQENDPYNFLNTYIRKMGYLQVAQKAKKRPRRERPLVASRGENGPVEATINSKKDDYASDFDVSVVTPVVQERIAPIPFIDEEAKENVAHAGQSGVGDSAMEKSNNVVEEWLEHSFGKGLDNSSDHSHNTGRMSSESGLVVEKTPKRENITDARTSSSSSLSAEENEVSLIENEPPPKDEFFEADPVDPPKFPVLTIPPLNFANLRVSTPPVNEVKPSFHSDKPASQSSSTAVSVPVQISSPSSRSSSPKRLSTPEGSGSEVSVAFSLSSASKVTPTEPLTPRQIRFEIKEERPVVSVEPPHFPADFVPLHPIVLPVDTDAIEKLAEDITHRSVADESVSIADSVVERYSDGEIGNHAATGSTEKEFRLHINGDDKMDQNTELDKVDSNVHDIVSPTLSPMLSIPDAFVDDFDTFSDDEGVQNQPDRVKSPPKKTETATHDESNANENRSDIASIRSDFLSSSHSEIGQAGVNLQDFDNIEVDTILSDIAVHETFDLDLRFPSKNAQELSSVEDELEHGELLPAADDIVSESGVTVSIVDEVDDLPANACEKEIEEVNNDNSGGDKKVDGNDDLFAGRKVGAVDGGDLDAAQESARSTSSSGHSIIDDLLGVTRSIVNGYSPDVNVSPQSSPRLNLSNNASPSLSPKQAFKPIDISLPSDDWMEDDIFTAVHNPVVMPEVAETVTESTEKLRKQGEYTRQHKVDSFYAVVDAMCRLIHQQALSASYNSFHEISSDADQHEEEAMLFDSIIDVCEEKFIFPGTPTRKLQLSKVKLPSDADHFVALVWKSVEDVAARMVLPDVALHAGRMEQDDVEQQMVYDLAFQDLERNEAQWCDFKQSEAILKEECVSVVWNDLINEYLIELKKTADKRSDLPTTDVAGW
ncbi:uncharacterized protein LOC129581553 [Paramacrobiotus metropolitanus]|uniref:uncharacterized protein LOC129581553 n=1 Tax=Paramacrobiotus metropolitanus TaxID=2943436 RepID=UPI002445BA92|nr:uncharacterized protein LOC129581553 [Paramacrobiotus metropolitanus]